jgi:hypothetical protein
MAGVVIVGYTQIDIPAETTALSVPLPAGSQVGDSCWVWEVATDDARFIPGDPLSRGSLSSLDDVSIVSASEAYPHRGLLVVLRNFGGSWGTGGGDFRVYGPIPNRMFQFVDDVGNDIPYSTSDQAFAFVKTESWPMYGEPMSAQAPNWTLEYESEYGIVGEADTDLHGLLRLYSVTGTPPLPDLSEVFTNPEPNVGALRMWNVEAISPPTQWPEGHGPIPPCKQEERELATIGSAFTGFLGPIAEDKAVLLLEGDSILIKILDSRSGTATIVDGIDDEDGSIMTYGFRSAYANGVVAVFTGQNE